MNNFNPIVKLKEEAEVKYPDAGTEDVNFCQQTAKQELQVH